MISYEQPESAVKWSDSMSRTRRVRRRRRRLIAATSSAAGVDVDRVDTRARGKAFAQASAMHPDPVPMSSTFFTRAASIHGRNPFDELGDRRTGNQHAFIDEERQAREPGLVREIGERNTFGDPPAQQRLARARGARRSRRRSDSGESNGRLQGMQHQRRGFVACVVRAMSEEDARALQAARGACDQFGDGDVE